VILTRVWRWSAFPGLPADNWVGPKRSTEDAPEIDTGGSLHAEIWIVQSWAPTAGAGNKKGPEGSAGLMITDLDWAGRRGANACIVAKTARLVKQVTTRGLQNGTGSTGQGALAPGVV